MAMARRKKMSKQCKKCLRGAMTVHIAANGLCEECETERAWKNADRQTILAAQKSNVWIITKKHRSI